MAICKKKVNMETESVLFEFANDKVLHIMLGDLSDEMLRRLALHGASQKIGDSYAGAESIEAAVLNAQQVINQLNDGLWISKSSKGGIWIEAMARLTGESIEETLAKFSALDEEAQKKAKKHPAVKKAKADIERERAEKQAAGAEEFTL